MMDYVIAPDRLIPFEELYHYLTDSCKLKIAQQFADRDQSVSKLTEEIKQSESQPSATSPTEKTAVRSRSHQSRQASSLNR